LLDDAQDQEKVHPIIFLLFHQEYILPSRLRHEPTDRAAALSVQQEPNFIMDEKDI
jgi:hypothetical protein